MKSTLYKIIYANMLVFISMTGTAFAQTDNANATVSGSLLDEQDKPLGFATASLLNAKDSTIVKGTLSNDAGVYVFDHLKAGSYLVR